MAVVDVKELSELITQLRIDLAKMDTKLDQMKDVYSKVETIETIVTQTSQSTKMAHDRLDKIDRVIYWLATTVIGAILAGLVTFILKGGFAA